MTENMDVSGLRDRLRPIAESHVVDMLGDLIGPVSDTVLRVATDHLIGFAQAILATLPVQDAMRQTLMNIAEGNLGDLPWQANYARIKEIALAALSAPNVACERVTDMAVAGAVATVAQAIRDADDRFGYSCKLTRLVDGVSTYQLWLRGDEELREFESHDDAMEFVGSRRNEDRALHILSALAILPEVKS